MILFSSTIETIFKIAFYIEAAFSLFLGIAGTAAGVIFRARVGKLSEFVSLLLVTSVATVILTVIAITGVIQKRQSLLLPHVVFRGVLTLILSAMLLIYTLVLVSYLENPNAAKDVLLFVFFYLFCTMFGLMSMLVLVINMVFIKARINEQKLIQETTHSDKYGLLKRY